jgi:hypothetical protein
MTNMGTPLTPASSFSSSSTGQSPAFSLLTPVAKLVAEAKVVSALGYVECDVIDQTGKLVAKAASTCLKRMQERKEA